MNTWVSVMPRKSLFTGLAECIVCVCVGVVMCAHVMEEEDGRILEEEIPGELWPPNFI